MPLLPCTFPDGPGSRYAVAGSIWPPSEREKGVVGARRRPAAAVRLINRHESFVSMILIPLPDQSIKNFSALVFMTALFLNQVSCKNETITEDDTAEQTFHSRDSSDSSGANISEKLSFLRLNPDSLDFQNFSLYPKEVGENIIAEIHIPHQKGAADL